MFYTTLAPNLQTNCSTDCAADCSASGTVATITTTAQLIAICVLATPTLTSNDPPYSAETTHDLSTSLCFCPLSLLFSCCCSLLFLCSLTHTHSAKAAAFHFCFVFILFILAIWHFAFFECVREWERKEKREWEGEKELHLQFAFRIT